MKERCELAVIGAGPAGLEAAIAAAEAGVSVVLVDHLPQTGGQYYKQYPRAFQSKGSTATEKDGEALIHRLDALPIKQIKGALVWGLFAEEGGEGWVVSLHGDDAVRTLHAGSVILASGAYDTPVAFPGWTLPGVITCGAALVMLKNQRIAPFRRVLVSGTGPLLLSAAAHLIDAGVEVVAVCEANQIQARAIKHGPTMLKERHRLTEGAKYLTTMLRAKTPYQFGRSVIEVRGGAHVEAAVTAQLDADGTPISGTEQTFAVDAVISGYGLTPNTGLARMIDCKFVFQPNKGGWVPVRDQRLQTSQKGVYMAGDCAGIGGAENSRLEGRIAGISAAAAAGRITSQQAEALYQKIRAASEQQQRFGKVLGELFPAKAGLIALAHEDTILCRCEEITLGGIRAAVTAGARTIAEVKMITRSGMGNCQGRMCERSVTAAVLKDNNLGMTPESVGMYTVRPPLEPLPFGFFVKDGLEGN